MLQDCTSPQEFKQLVRKTAQEQEGRREKQELALEKEGDEGEEFAFWQVGATTATTITTLTPTISRQEQGSGQTSLVGCPSTGVITSKDSDDGFSLIHRLSNKYGNI